MKKLALAAFVSCLASAGAGQAITIFDVTGDSLHGATGSLTFDSIDANTTKIIWSLDTTGFHDAAAIQKNTAKLTHVAFKVGGLTSVSLVNPSLGTSNFPSNVNNNGCSGFSNAKMVCLTLNDPINATTNQVINVEFLAQGSLKLDEEVSFRGKFGPANGWVISEAGTLRRFEEPIPEPSSALVFGAGLLVAGAVRARRR